MKSETNLSVLSLLDNYLAHHQDEAPGLVALRKQLADPAEGAQAWFSRKNMRGHVTTSALVLSPDLKQVLLIHHNVYQRWLEPGGHYEGDGSLWESATREVEEETGLTGLENLGGPAGAEYPLDVDTHPIAANSQKAEGAHWHHDFLFLARACKNNELVPQEEEVGGAQWLPLSQYFERTDARSRRLQQKLRAMGLA